VNPEVALASFTVQFEVGPETRALIERLVGTPVQLELGPKTRDLLEELLRQQESVRPNK
jgi:hypothetical protein